MTLTLQLQLIPAVDQSRQMRDTVERFNTAATWLAGEAFRLRTANKIDLQHRYYRELREQFGLSAQMAVRCIAQTCEAYKRDKTKRPRFRRHAAMPYDQRMLSFKGLDRVSLLTLEGRIRVPVLMGRYQRERFTASVGQSDLVLRRDGKWFLLVTVDVPDGAPIPVTEFVGVDLGVANLATTSDGQQVSGETVEVVRVRHLKTRRSIGKKTHHRRARRTRKNARRALKRVGQKESRFRKHVNHVISKQLVRHATDTGRGLALEDLTGIHDRTRFRRAQRAKMGGWAFAQLRAFVTYKAQLAGVPVVLVDPRNTSRTCSQCGHCEKANRKNQAEFQCQSCGHTLHADLNAAINIAAAAARVSPREVSQQSPFVAA